MARYMSEDNKPLFRAVIVHTTTYADGRPDHVSTEYCGPFVTSNPASAQISREKRYVEYRNANSERFARRRGDSAWDITTVTGHVETTATAWTRVGT